MNDSTVVVLGCGYVGLPIIKCAALSGFRVIGLDVDKDKINQLQNGICPYVDDDLTSFLQSNTDVTFTTDEFAIREGDIVISCVPTPIDSDSTPDLKPFVSSMKMIGRNMRQDQLVVGESTVYPGISEEIAIPTLEEISGMKCNKDFLFAHAPERIDPGNPTWNVTNIPRVVGGSNNQATQRAIRFYTSILKSGTLVKPMSDLRSAEAVKVLENTFRDVNIAFVNELAKSFDKMGLNLSEVIDGASTKPFGFMPFRPGPGVGGHCIPVDPYYLIRASEDMGYDPKFLKMAREINDSMPEYAVGQLSIMLNRHKRPVKDTCVGVLGISYKPGLSDKRHSPAMEIIKDLRRRGAIVHTYDENIPDESSHQSVVSLLDDSEAVIIANADPEFKKLVPADFLHHEVKIVIDGPNCLDIRAFQRSSLSYTGIGSEYSYSPDYDDNSEQNILSLVQGELREAGDSQG